jgi:hypothetical protein
MSRKRKLTAFDDNNDKPVSEEECWQVYLNKEDKNAYQTFLHSNESMLSSSYASLLFDLYFSAPESKQMMFSDFMDQLPSVVFSQPPERQGFLWICYLLRRIPNFGHIHEIFDYDSLLSEFTNRFASNELSRPNNEELISVLRRCCIMPYAEIVETMHKVSTLLLIFFTELYEDSRLNRILRLALEHCPSFTVQFYNEFRRLFPGIPSLLIFPY